MSDSTNLSPNFIKEYFSCWDVTLELATALVFCMLLQYAVHRSYPVTKLATFKVHQECQVPKIEGFLNLIFGYFWGGVSRIHKPYPYSLYR